MSNVASQPDAGKLPAGPGRKKIAKTGTNALCWRDAGSAAKHILIYHRAAVIFAHCLVPDGRYRFAGIRFGWTVSRIWRVAGLCPFPYIPIKLSQVRGTMGTMRIIRMGGGRMQVSVLGKLPIDFLAGTSIFPLCLGGQSRPGPSCIGIGFIIGNMD